MENNRTKQKLIKGEPVLMAFLTINDISTAEVIALSGIDIIAIDNEHYGFDERDIINIAHAVKSRGGTCLLRTAQKDVKTLSHYMDLGIDGFLAMMTSTVEEAKAVVAATKYHPLGKRGISGMCKGFNYGFIGDMNVGEYMEYLNRNTIIIITLESEEGAENAGAIAKLDGIDCVSVGAGDLSLSMGYKADKNHPEVVKIVEKAEKEIAEAGMITTVAASTPDEVEEVIKKGGKLLMIGTDLAVIRNVFTNLGNASKTR